MAPSGLSTCVFRCDMLARALRASKVTSPVLTAAYFPGVPGEWLLVSRARKLEMLQLLHFFFFFVQHTITMRIILSKKAIKFFGMKCALQSCGIHCHIAAKLDRSLSEPGHIQVLPKASRVHHDLHASSGGTGGGG